MSDNQTAAAKEELSFGLRHEQAKAMRLIAYLSLAFVPVTIAMGWLFTHMFLVPLIGTLLAALPAALVFWVAPATARMLAGLALVGQAMVFTATFGGHPWQPDTHMLFFAMLAALVAMVDTWVILVCAGAIVVQHLGMTLIFPALIYPSTDLIPNVVRTLLHGALVALEVWALVRSVIARRKLDLDDTHLIESMSEVSASSEAARLRAVEALEEAEAAKKEIAATMTELERVREAERDQAQERDRLAHAARIQAEQEATRQVEAAREQQRVVDELRQALSALGRGDLRHQIRNPLPEGYEDLRHDYNAMLVNLSQTLRIALEHTGTIDGETSSISGAAQSLSGRSEHQAASMEATSSALEEITASVHSVAERANAARTRSQKVSENAEAGRSVVASAVQTMHEIETSAEKISRIIAVIDDISFQTNLLALNAGVEAARVGDAGRGFAVVASEVRALAQRSADASREINGLITESGGLIKQGVARVEETGHALLLILDQVKQIADDVAEIAHATSEQSKGIGEVNHSMQGLGQLTQQIAAMFEETTAATQILERETSQLRSVLAQFETDEPGGHWPRRLIRVVKWSRGVRRTASFHPA